MSQPLGWPPKVNLSRWGPQINNQRKGTLTSDELSRMFSSFTADVFVDSSGCQAWSLQESPRSSFGMSAFRKVLQWRRSCYHPTPVLFTHTWLDSSNGALRKKKKRSNCFSSLRLSFPQSWRSVSTSLRKDPYASFSSWSYCLNIGFLFAKPFLVFNYLSWFKPERFLSQDLQWL